MRNSNCLSAAPLRWRHVTDWRDVIAEICDWLQVASSWIILCLYNIMLMRSARVVQVLQDLLHSCMVDVIGFCCNLQPCMLHVASCIVIGVLGAAYSLLVPTWALTAHKFVVFQQNKDVDVTVAVAVKSASNMITISSMLSRNKVDALINGCTWINVTAKSFHKTNKTAKMLSEKHKKSKQNDKLTYIPNL